MSDNPRSRFWQGPAVVQSPLQRAVLRGQTEEVRRCLTSSSTADVNVKDGACRTALMLAVEVDSPDIIDLLLQHGAEPNEGNEFGSSALYQAVREKRPGCAKRLLLGGALVNAQSLRKRHAPLHAACTNGDVQMMDLLLDSGADPDVLDYRHRGPLHVAAVGGFSDCLARLLQSGAQVDVQDIYGLTPLGLSRDAVCRSALREADAVLSAKDLRHMLRENPAALQQLLDGGVRPGKGGVLEVSYKPLRNIGEAGNPFEAEFMTELQQSGRLELFGHPAVELLLQLTCQDGNFVCHTAAKILWCVVFLVSLLSTMAVDLYRAGGDNRTLDAALKGFLVTLNCAQLVFLLMKLCVIGKRFFLQGRRWPVIVETVFAFVVVFLRNDSDKRLVYALAVLMSFLELNIALESIYVWKITRAISSLLHVTRSIAEYLLVYSPMLIGFSIAFFVMFGSHEQEKSSIFHSYSVVINMAAMILGEVDVMAAEKHALMTTFGYAMSTIVFTMFVIIVPIVMLNLLLALTINDTTKFLSEEGAQFRQILVNRITWYQRAAFMIDRWADKMKPLMPHCLFVRITRYSVQYKWKSVLPRPAATVKATPLITVGPFAQGGKMVDASVAGSSRRFRVSSDLRQSLDRIVQAQHDSELDAEDGVSVCGSSVPSMLRSRSGSVWQSGSRPYSMLQRSISAAHSCLCRSRHSSVRNAHSSLRRSRRCAAAGSGAVLAEQLTAIQEKLDWQQTTQQRMVEQLDLQHTTQQRILEHLDLQQTTRHWVEEQLQTMRARWPC